MRARLKTRLAVAAGVLSAALVLWAGGLLWFVSQIPQGPDPASAAASTDAIVVLTGGSRRLATGFELLGARKAHKLFVSGVNRDTPLDEMLRANAPAEGDAQAEAWPAAADLDGLLACCVALDHEARDTFGNARETAAWMAQEGYRSLRIVTSNYHMLRSLFEFRRVMPEVMLVPHPVIPDQVDTAGWWRRPRTAWLIVSEYNKFLGAHLRPRWIKVSGPGVPRGESGRDPGDGARAADAGS